MSTKRKWDISSDEIKKKCINDIVARTDEVTDDSIGIITAEDVLNIITTAIGPDLYNQGVEEATKLIKERLSDLQVDLDLLNQT